MKKILVIMSRFPYPPIGGDKLKSYNLLKILSKHYDVHLVSLIDRQINSNDFNFCKQYCKSFRIFHKSKYQSLFNLIKSLYNGKPLQVNYYYFKDIQKYIDKKLTDSDFVINTLIRTSEYVINSNKPKCLDMVDSIALNYQHSLDKVKSPFWKIVYNLEANRLLKYEKKCIESYNVTIFVNNEEANFWSKFGKTLCIPNGVDEKLFIYNKIDQKYSNYVAFFGKMDYQPNIDAVLWFVDNVLYKLDKNIKFIIIGVNPVKKIIHLAKKYRNVEVTGFVDDPYIILNSCLCVVAPMQTGGGIQNKILEAMALGTINIISSLAAIPIGAENGKDYIIVDDPIEMANTINEIYKKPENFSYYKENSRRFIRCHFTWSKYEEAIINTLEEIIHDCT